MHRNPHSQAYIYISQNLSYFFRDLGYSGATNKIILKITQPTHLENS